MSKILISTSCWFKTCHRRLVLGLGGAQEAVDAAERVDRALLALR